MKDVRVRYTPEAAVLNRKLHPEVKGRVREGIRSLLKDPLLGHELRLELAGFRSLRVKGYRIIYRMNDEEAFIEIMYVGRRLDVYESFRSLLLEKRGEG